MAGHNTPISLIQDLRDIWRRLSALERLSLRSAQVELDDNRTAPWQTPSLLNGFTSFGSGRANARYYRDTFGRVYLEGSVARAAGAVPLTIFTLAVGYRPAFLHRFLVTSEAGTFSQFLVEVNTNGNVVLGPGSASTAGLEIPLDIIQFRTT